MKQKYEQSILAKMLSRLSSDSDKAISELKEKKLLNASHKQAKYLRQALSFSDSVLKIFSGQKEVTTFILAKLGVIALRDRALFDIDHLCDVFGSPMQRVYREIETLVIHSSGKTRSELAKILEKKKAPIVKKVNDLTGKNDAEDYFAKLSKMILNSWPSTINKHLADESNMRCRVDEWNAHTWKTSDCQKAISHLFEELFIPYSSPNVFVNSTYAWYDFTITDKALLPLFLTALQMIKEAPSELTDLVPFLNAQTFETNRWEGLLETLQIPGALKLEGGQNTSQPFIYTYTDWKGDDHTINCHEAYAYNWRGKAAEMILAQLEEYQKSHPNENLDTLEPGLRQMYASNLHRKNKILHFRDLLNKTLLHVNKELTDATHNYFSIETRAEDKVKALHKMSVCKMYLEKIDCFLKNNIPLVQFIKEMPERFGDLIDWVDEDKKNNVYLNESFPLIITTYENVEDEKKLQKNEFRYFYNVGVCGSGFITSRCLHFRTNTLLKEGTQLLSKLIQHEDPIPFISPEILNNERHSSSLDNKAKVVAEASASETVERQKLHDQIECLLSNSPFLSADGDSLLSEFVSAIRLGLNEDSLAQLQEKMVQVSHAKTLLQSTQMQAIQQKIKFFQDGSRNPLNFGKARKAKSIQMAVWSVPVLERNRLFSVETVIEALGKKRNPLTSGPAKSLNQFTVLAVADEIAQITVGRTDESLEKDRLTKANATARAQRVELENKISRLGVADDTYIKGKKKLDDLTAKISTFPKALVLAYARAPHQISLSIEMFKDLIENSSSPSLDKIYELPMLQGDVKGQQKLERLAFTLGLSDKDRELLEKYRYAKRHPAESLLFDKNLTEVETETLFSALRNATKRLLTTELPQLESKQRLNAEQVAWAVENTNVLKQKKELEPELETLNQTIKINERRIVDLYQPLDVQEVLIKMKKELPNYAAFFNRFYVVFQQHSRDPAIKSIRVLVDDYVKQHLLHPTDRIKIPTKEKEQQLVQALHQKLNKTDSSIKFKIFSMLAKLPGIGGWARHKLAQDEKLREDSQIEKMKTTSSDFKNQMVKMR